VRGVLVVAELSIAVVLLVSAGLLLQSLWRLRHVSPGFNPQQVLSFNLALPDNQYSSAKQVQFFETLTTRLKALPGVHTASIVMPLPLSGDRYSISFETEGRPVPKGEEPSADFFVIGPDYLSSMEIPLLKGRNFDAHDQHQSPQVIIVSEGFARRYFPNEEPLGKRIKPGISSYEDDPSQLREIVGVVADVKSRSLGTEPRPAYYVPSAQVPFSQMTVVLKTSGDPHSLINAATREVNSMDGNLAVYGVKTLEEYLAASVAAPRFNTTLLAIFATVALILTIVGLYGVMSYSVAQRTGEIGLRMALGAQAQDVLSLIVGQGLKLVLLGLAAGLVGAFALTRLISSLLFGVGANDPWTFGMVALLLAGVALLACYIPARRAARVDPLEALRYQ
jgi:putative ABC transport system permease protein